MKKIIQSKLFLVGLLLLIIIGWYSQGKKQTQYDEYKCTTKKKSLKGVIKEIGGRANYMTILVNNLKERISLNI